MAERKTRRSAQAVGGGSTLEAIGGIAAIVVAILGLADVLPTIMAAIGAIILGGALMMEGATAAARALDIGGDAGAAAAGGGLSAEFVGGAAGIVLGILALLGLAPLTLLSITVLVFGGALLVGAGTTGRIRHAPGPVPEEGIVARGTTDSLSAASGADVLIGVGAIVLGILALVGFDPLMLVLVALLSVGVGVLLSGTTLTARMALTMRQRRTA